MTSGSGQTENTPITPIGVFFLEHFNHKKKRFKNRFLIVFKKKKKIRGGADIVTKKF